jgi:hypothetical protein
MLSINLVALKKIFKTKYLTHKHCIPSVVLFCGLASQPGDHEIYNFGGGPPALHHSKFSLYHKCSVLEKIFENW